MTDKNKHIIATNTITLKIRCLYECLTYETFIKDAYITLGIIDLSYQLDIISLGEYIRYKEWLKDIMENVTISKNWKGGY